MRASFLLEFGIIVTLRISLFAQELPLRGNWVQVTTLAEFSPRDSTSGTIHDEKLWLSKGYYHGNVLIRDLWSSDGAPVIPPPDLLVPSLSPLRANQSPHSPCIGSLDAN